MTGKTIEKPKTKKKRLSKGMRKHIRRLKQDARKMAIYS
jgi:hypothetical protein